MVPVTGAKPSNTHTYTNHARDIRPDHLASSVGPNLRLSQYVRRMGLGSCEATVVADSVSDGDVCHDGTKDLINACMLN